MAGIVGQRRMWRSGLSSRVNAWGAFLDADQVALMCRRQDGEEDRVQCSGGVSRGALRPSCGPNWEKKKHLKVWFLARFLPWATNVSNPENMMGNTEKHRAQREYIFFCIHWQQHFPKLLDKANQMWIVLTNIKLSYFFCRTLFSPLPVVLALWSQI